MLIMADMMPSVNTILFITRIYELKQCVCAAVFSHFSLHLIFSYLILEWISLWLNCALNMLRTHLNFNESLVVPVRACWPQLNCFYNRLFSREHPFVHIKLIHLWMAVAQTNTVWTQIHTHTRVNTHRLRCDSHCAVCTQWKEWMSSPLLTWCFTAGKTESPPSSLFIFSGKPPQPNYETPQLLCVDEKRFILYKFNLSWTPLHKGAECCRLENSECILV